MRVMEWERNGWVSKRGGERWVVNGDGWKMSVGRDVG